MRAGTLDTRIVLQRRTTAYSSTGEPSESWTTLATRWASIKPVTGDERNAAEQWVAREQTKFTVRWSADIDDLSPLDQVICPAGDASTSPTDPRSTYDIIAVLEPDRNQSMTIIAARRVA